MRSARLLAAALLVLTARSIPAIAQDLAFTSDCGNSWYTICDAGLCDGGRPREKNNWGQQTCLPAHPPFPNTGSFVILPTTVILDGDAAIQGLQTTAGGGLIMIQGKTLSLTAHDVINAGEIIVNDTGLPGTFLTQLTLGDPTQLSSSGRITLNSPDRAVLTAIGLIMNNSGHTIQGTGQITAPLQNAGTVDANIPASTLTIPFINVTNTGRLRASSGGILLLDHVSLDNANGQILGEDGEVHVRATTIAGGTLNTHGTGAISTAGGTTGTTRFSGITNQGLLRIYPGASAEVDQLPLINNGTILINPNRDSFVATFLTFPTTGTLRGTGTLVLNSPGLIGARLESGAALTQEAGHTIRGEGRIPAALYNQGLVRADINGGLLELVGPFKTNTGTLLASGGGLLGIAGIIIVNNGGHIVADNGTVQLYGAANIIGGTLETSGTGTIECYGDPPSVLTDVTNRGQIHLAGFLALSGSSLVNDGTITVGDCPSFVTKYFIVYTSLTVSGHGSIVLCGQEDRTVMYTSGSTVLTNGPGHTIRGYGVLAGNVINHGIIQADVPSRYLFVDPSGGTVVNAGNLRVLPSGTLVLNRAASFSQTAAGEIAVDGALYVNHAPLTLAEGTLGGTGTVNASVINAGATIQPGASPGTLTINGPYAQGPNGRLEIEVGGLTPGLQHDVLAVAGSATLGGDLRIVPTGGFVPQPGQQFTVLTAAQVWGTFASLSGPGQYTATYGPTTVVVTVLDSPICGQIVPADLDFDCDVDGDDLAAFAACASGPAVPLSPGCKVADFDSDNDADQADYAVFQRCFSGPGNAANPACAY